MDSEEWWGYKNGAGVLSSLGQYDEVREQLTEPTLSVT